MGNNMQDVEVPPVLHKAEETPPWYRSPLVPLLIPAALVVCLYYGVMGDLINDWSDDPNYSHGFLVPLFSAYLIWERRDTLKRIDFKGSWLGLPVLLAGVGTLILGQIGAEFFVTRCSLVFVLGGLVLLLLGREAFKIVCFALLFLFFMIPPPAIIFNVVAFPLQMIAAKNAAWALDLLGIPVLLEGNVLHLSRNSLGVTEACSGIRSLISLLTLASVWGYFAFKTFWPRIVMFLAAIPVTMAGNSVRVIATGLITQYLGLEYAEGVYHTLLGMLIFVVAFIGLLLLQKMIEIVQYMCRRGAKI